MSPSVAELIESVWSSPSLGAVLVDATFKATVVLGAAALAVLLVRKGSASGRHLLWALATVAALCLPALALLLPSWRVEVVSAPASTVSPANAPRLVLTPAPRVRPSFEGAARRTFEWERPERVWRHPLQVYSPSPAGDPPRSTHTRVVLTSMDPSVLLNLSEDAEGPLLVAARGFTPSRFLSGLWAAGAALLLVRLVYGRMKVAALGRSARDVNDGRRVLAQQLCAALGIGRTVRLVESTEPVLPMTWGVLRPTVLLPASSRGWTAERLQLVLLHELAHVRRLDALTQLCAQLACAFYWFHPLVHLASQRMRSLREYACDDHVLGAGRRPSEYAGELLEMVRALGHRPRLAAATLPMAQRNELQERLMAILDPNVRRGSFSAWRGALAALAMAAAVIPLAAIQPAVAQPAPPTPAPAPAAPAKDKNLPRISRPESERRVAPVVPGSAPAPAPMPGPIAAPGSAPAPAPMPGPIAAPNVSSAPVVPGVPAAPVAPAPPTPPAPPSFSRHEHDDDDDGHEHPHRQLIRSLKQDEQAAVDAIRRAEQARSDDDVLDGLEDVGREFNLAAESTRKEFLRVADKLRGDEERADALVALLRGAPITVDTGHEVLKSAAKIRSDDSKLEVLKYMHRIKESELVRGPLAQAYLDVAEQLRDDESLSEALKDLLHPDPVPAKAIHRALALLDRVRDDDGKDAVLQEVTDHQSIDAEVEALYRKAAAAISDEGDRREVLSRLDEAKRDGDHSRKRFVFRMKGDFSKDAYLREVAEAARAQAEAAREQAQAEREAQRAQRDAERAQAQAEREAERARGQAERETERARAQAERDAARADQQWKAEMRRFGAEQQRLKAQADELRRAAKVLQEQMKERAKALRLQGKEVPEDFSVELDD